MFTRKELEGKDDDFLRQYFSKLTKSEFLKYFGSRKTDEYHLTGETYMIMQEEYIIKKNNSKGWF